MIRETFNRVYDKIIGCLIVNRYKGTLALRTVTGWSNKTRFAHSICTCMISCIGKRKHINTFFIINSLFMIENFVQRAFSGNKSTFRSLPDRQTFDQAKVDQEMIWLNRLEMVHLRLPCMSLHPILFLVHILNKILFQDQTFDSFINPWMEKRITGTSAGFKTVPEEFHSDSMYSNIVHVSLAPPKASHKTGPFFKNQGVNSIKTLMTHLVDIFANYCQLQTSCIISYY